MWRTARYDVISEQDIAYKNSYESFTTLIGETDIDRSTPIKLSEYDQVTGNRLQRFLLRAVVGVLGPFVVCAYFIIIWRLYLLPAQAVGAVTYGLRGATWIFYSWFVAGVLGLSLSLYGLTGVEAAMLMEPSWNVGDATKLMLHADNTWSGPGGWLKAIKWSTIPRSGRGRKMPPGLWFVLAAPSLLVFIAWPLSGLTMETTQGYCRPDVPRPAEVTGFSYDTFNERGSGEAISSAAMAWKGGTGARIPGVGIVYTPEGFDRSQNDFLDQLPTVLPRTDNVPTIFLVPQADNPVEGNHWGLLLQYNCTIIDRAQDFQIINKFERSRWRYSRLAPIYDGDSNAYREVSEEQGLAIEIISQARGHGFGNLDTIAEFGNQRWPIKKLDAQSSNRTELDCYFGINETITGDYPGIHEPQIFEMALWQGLRETISPINETLPYNLSIDHNITDYYGEYTVGGLRPEKKLKSSQPMTAIGVQCRASSNVGRADINGIKSSYSNFERTDTRLPSTWDRCGFRFAASSAFDVLSKKGWGTGWVEAIFMSASAPSPYYGTYDRTFKNGSQATKKFLLQPAYLQAEQLRQSLLHAYASYAVQLMYNGGNVYTTPNGSTLSFTNPNATEFQHATIIKPGVVPAVVPLGLFCVWALVSSTLGLVYGFRRRWTETLDGHTMFRMGAELSEHARRELLKTSNTGIKDDDQALNDIPGLIGDTKPEMYVGRIGLVASDKADKKKIYE